MPPVALVNPSKDAATADGGITSPIEAVSRSERRTKAVALITAAAMGMEIVAGWWFNSMALLADGWHMGTHAAAIGLSAMAYALSRRYRNDLRFSFGTWKIEVLAGFTSALTLVAVAAGMVWASMARLLDPQPIQYLEAIVVTVIGLGVNLICVWMLGPDHGHGHGHGHSHGHAHRHANGHGHAHGQDQGHQHASHHQDHAAPTSHHDDLNLRSAYLHVLADAATSVLAIVALLGGLFWHWAWLDPAMGLVGAALVLRWGWGLIRDTVRSLLDCEGDHPFATELGQAIREQAPWSEHVDVLDLRVWRIGSAQFAATVQLHSHVPWVSAVTVRQFLARYPALGQVNIEVLQGGKR